MTTIADLYPEGCKVEKPNIILSIKIYFLAIVPPIIGSTGKDDKSIFIGIINIANILCPVFFRE
jgi:hypothetical protein